MGSIRLCSSPSIWHLVTQGKGALRYELVIPSCGDPAAQVQWAAESLAAYDAAWKQRAVESPQSRVQLRCSMVLRAEKIDRQRMCSVVLQKWQLKGS